MTEDYLHYIWKFQKIDHAILATVQGEAVVVKKQGHHNHNSGPDFSEARVTIGKADWFGSVEIHIKTSDWRKHGHQRDKAYNNVVLHVVYEHDEDIYNQNGEKIPTLELKTKVNHEAYFQYERFLQNAKIRPCSDLLQEVPKLTLISTIDEMLVGRLLRKSQDIRQMLQDTSNDWEQVFHQLLFKYLGMKVNGEAMLELSKRVPYLMLQKHSHDITLTEALLFGQSGMLNDPLSNDYHQRLREEYLYLKQKLQLTAMTGTAWKFSRMRPPNFPSMRIAQLAAIYTSYQNLFQLVRDKSSIRELQLVFSAEPSEFWQSHYTFKSESKKQRGGLGKMALQNIIINVVAPFAFYYGKEIGDSSYEDYALLLLESLPGEKNNITKKFDDFNVGVLSAKDSQSFIQLNNEFCKKKKCLNCKIGVYLLQ